MKNADMPAMPLQLVFDPSGNPVTASDACYETGLTKREHFAAMAMQGLLVNMGRNGFDNVNRAVDEAVKAANALLAELERTK